MNILRDYLFRNRAFYLIIDEIDKMSPRDQPFLLNLMELGIVNETKYGKTREVEIRTSVFASCNDPRKLSAPLQSRFFIVELDQYTYEQFYEITLRLLDTHRCNICNIIFDSFETLNAHNRMEHSEARHSPEGVS